MPNRLALAALVLAVLTVTPAAFGAPGSPDAPSPQAEAISVAPAADCGTSTTPDLATLLDPLAQVLQPHCCSQQQVDDCRSDCKAQGPGCKGTIGCRAGECVCTCSCPG